MRKHNIKFYPVENADNALIKLSDNTTIQIDCQIRNDEEKSNGDKIYDVKKDLIKELQKDDNNIPFVDLFVQTHPHKDHCLGFEGNYYCGNPNDYSDSNRENEEIIIGELWVTKIIFNNDVCDQAKALRKEAKRRRNLFYENPTEANKYGNRIHIIGYNQDDEKVDGLCYKPSDLINEFNGKKSDYLEVFIHAPFKSDVVKKTAYIEKNATSIVFQASLKMGKNEDIKSKVIFGGDADHYIWEKVLRKTEDQGREERLEWDIFLAPHHCSWSFFNDRPYDENKEPKDYALDFLDKRNPNAYVVASSVKVEDNDKNPPHYHAMKEYKKKVGDGYFRNTSVTKGSAPKPLEFSITDSGAKLIKSEVAASGIITSNPTPRAGIK